MQFTQVTSTLFLLCWTDTQTHICENITYLLTTGTKNTWYIAYIFGVHMHSTKMHISEKFEVSDIKFEDIGKILNQHTYSIQKQIFQGYWHQCDKVVEEKTCVPNTKIVTVTSNPIAYV